MNLYKFRACNDNFFNELEKRYIYFSKIDKLNDPMEGIKHMHWQGDPVAWSNFLKHYFFCLFNIIEEDLYNAPEEDCLSKLSDTLKVFDVTEYLALQNNGRELLSKVNELFLEHESIIKCMELISNQILYKTELTVILTAIGYYAIATIKQINNHDFQAFHSFTTPLEDLVKLQMDYYSIKEKYFFIEEWNKEAYLKIAINALKNNKKSPSDPALTLLNEFAINFSQAYSFLQKRFVPQKIASDYINMLENMEHNKISMSCFSKDYSNAAMWSHYANNHKGICLIFDRKLLTDLPEEFSCHEVLYNNESYEVNFFEILFSYLVDKQKLCINEEYKGSLTYTKFLDARQLYKNGRHSNIDRKLVDWSYENEFRIVCHARTNDEITEFLYPPSALAGIIFGIKICPKTRRKIMNILLRKYTDFDKSQDINFKFYQAYYSQESSKIEIFEYQNIMELSTKLITRIISQ